jgi:hypothetical protein
VIIDRPPTGWIRPALSNRAAYAAMHRKLKELLGEFQFDHRPALWERQFDTEKNDTIPAANDWNYIEVITVDEHKRRSHGTKATSYGSDAHERAKAKRIAKRTALIYNMLSDPPPHKGLSDAYATILGEEPIAVHRNVPIFSRALPGGRKSKLKRKLSGKVVKRRANKSGAHHGKNR